MSYIDRVVSSNKPTKFRARWRDPSGKEKAKTFDSRREAREFLVKVDAAKSTGIYVDPQHGKILVRDFAETWLAGRDVRASTQARDESYVTKAKVSKWTDQAVM